MFKNLYIITILMTLFVGVTGCCDCNKGPRPADPVVSERLNYLKTQIADFYDSKMIEDSLDHQSTNLMLNQINDVYRYIANVEGTHGETATQMKTFQEKFNKDIKAKQSSGVWSSIEKDKKKVMILRELEQVLYSQVTAGKKMRTHYAH